jgi:transcriptional regulator with XRE-family HTH domain
MCAINHTVDKTAVTARLLTLARGRAKKLGLSLVDLTRDIGTSAARLEKLKKGQTSFSAEEIQLLCTVVGIGLNEVFPRNFSQDEFKACYDDIVGKGSLAVFAGGAGATCSSTLSEDKAAAVNDFAKSMVELHHYMECLKQF